MMIEEYGSKGANTQSVLAWLCPQILPLKFRVIDKATCIETLDRGRVVVATIYLSDKQWTNFSEYFREYPNGILSPEFLDKRMVPDTKDGCHAFLITDCID